MAALRTWSREAKFRCGALLVSAVLFLPSAAAQQSVPPPPPPDQTPAAAYVPPPPVVFENRIPADQLTFLEQFNGVESGKLMRDKRFRQVMRSVIPHCTFHYGRDMSLSDAASSGEPARHQIDQQQGKKKSDSPGFHCNGGIW